MHVLPLTTFPTKFQFISFLHRRKTRGAIHFAKFRSFDIFRRVDEVEVIVQDLKTDVEELKTDVEELKADVQELKTGVNNVDNKLDNMIGIAILSQLPVWGMFVVMIMK